MRPSLVFVGLFAVLIVVYALLRDSLGSSLIFALQAAIVVVLLAGAIWFRRSRENGGLSLLGDGADEPADAEATAVAEREKEDSEAQPPRAS
jgi:hypothetical protein